MRSFYKYSATGNDFILFSEFFDISKQEIISVCERKRGVGADGVILFKKLSSDSFELVIYNSDGSLAGMCGNAARAATDYFLEYVNANTERCEIIVNNSSYYSYRDDNKVFLEFYSIVKKGILAELETEFKSHAHFDSGVPHYICEVEGIDTFDVVSIGRRIRNFFSHSGGVNVDFYEKVRDDSYKLRVYERGVEDETLCCGTGVVATFKHLSEKHGLKTVNFEMKGGAVLAFYDDQKECYTFGGSVKKVFEAKIDSLL